jgi:alginate O-acetyltransferase complex protein AlgI
MLFDSYGYFIFLPIVACLFFATENTRVRAVLFIAASYFFYALFEPRYLLILMYVTAVSYVAAHVLHRLAGTNAQRIALAVSLVLMAMPLLAYKYFDFLSISLFSLIELAGIERKPFVLGLILPVGISFFTLQGMGYVIDVAIGRIEPSRDIVRFALFKSFFPQLVAGPIERAMNLLPQMELDAKLDYVRIRDGLRLILLGLVFKVIFSDAIADSVDPLYIKPAHYSGVAHLLGCSLFSFQIYGDFAGYSLVAIGSALIFGVRLMDNFRQPFLATNIPDFWRNWHISLTTWLKDYFFNFVQFAWRYHGDVGVVAAIMLTFLLVGLWHGAAWKFAFLGLTHGILVSWSSLTFARRTKMWQRTKIPLWAINIMRRATTFLLVSLSLVFFRSKTEGQSFEIFSRIFGNADGKEAMEGVWLALLASSLLLAVDMFVRSGRQFSVFSRPVRWAFYIPAVAVVSWKLMLNLQGSKPFIYFQF